MKSGNMENGPKKKKSKRNIILLAIAVVGLAFGIPRWWYAHNHETTDDSQIEGHILAVSSRVGAFVSQVYVRDEQAVKAGDTLFTLDPRELEIKVRLAEADLLAAQAAAKGGVAGAGARVAESQKTAAQANLESMAANLAKAKADVERTRNLFKQEIASRASLDAAEAAFRSAQATYAAAAEAARGSSFTIAGANAQVRAADARLVAAEAALDAARLQLGYTVVTAPTSGHIAKKNLENGQQIAAGQAVMAIVEDSPVWVVANLKETQLASVRPGENVEMEVDAFPGKTLKGRVASIQNATGARFSLLPPDNASGNFTKVVQRVPVRIDLVDPIKAGSGNPPLVPGMSVSVSIDIRSGG
ncbi:MAG: secretion protein HlyD family protein [Fibrobacteres bacterium]|nr:secretion protein HlyD family protein [Fibrobacterota bacterium]